MPRKIKNKDAETLDQYINRVLLLEKNPFSAGSIEYTAWNAYKSAAKNVSTINQRIQKIQAESVALQENGQKQLGEMQLSARMIFEQEQTRRSAKSPANTPK